ncbi:MAG: hypothetical protein Q9160_005468 [Pyrenula sp. 1 TL-2023]
MPPFEVQTAAEIFNYQEDPRNTRAVWSQEYFDDALYSQPLGFRAWALQERLLAPRVLAFGLGELFWDCSELPNACESFAGGIAGALGTTRPWKRLKLKQKTISDSEDRETLEGAWSATVEDYTNRKLTYPEKDKLLALSAVAARFGGAVDDICVAGHFWKTLPFSLAWSVLPSHRLKPSQTQARRMRNTHEEKSNKFPSWSWVSIDGPLKIPYRFPDENLIADAQKYMPSSRSDANPTGLITFASLQIKALCAEIEWNGVWKISDEETNGNITLKVTIDDSEDYPVAAALVRFLGSVEGLVLKEANLNEQLVYERIGHFSVYWPSVGESQERTLTLI